METRVQFQNRINEILQHIDPKLLDYNHDEYWMIEKEYEYIEFIAIENRLINTLIALKLAIGLHNGTYRKLTVSKDGQSYRLPYAIHPLSVCSMLMDLNLPLDLDDLDILYAGALCHDMIEDIDFKKHGKELYEDFFLDHRVYDTVKLLSKRYDFTDEEEVAFFHEIESHELALLIKLSDRGNNVEDLYNMKVAKVYEYVEETDRFFLPMLDYAKEHYTNHLQGFGILKDKIISLTDVARILVIRYGEYEEEKNAELEVLKAENEKLRKEWKALWKL